MKTNYNSIRSILLGSVALMMAADKATGGGKTSPESSTPPTDNATRIAQAKLRSEYVAAPDAWDAIDTPEFGGQSEIFALDIGEIAVGITYTGHQTSAIGGKEMEVHTGNTQEGSPLRLPIAASFLRALDQGQVQVGDVIAIKRFEDQTKKGGVGKGQAMQIFGVKVITRSGDAANQ